MRILHVADLHCRPAFHRWVTQHASEFDLTCLAGDFLDAGQPMALRQQVRITLDWLQTIPTPVCLCSGNHDFWLFENDQPDPDGELQWLLRARRRGVMIDGEVRQVGTQRVAASGWMGPLQVPLDAPVLWVTHAPPEQTPVAQDRDRGDCGDFETREVAQTLPRGSLVLSGHVHAPRRWWARLGEALCLNPGAQLHGEVPNHIVLDLRRGRATHVVDGTPVSALPLRR